MKTPRTHLLRSITLGLLSAAAILPAVAALTPAEVTGVLYMKQEEKMARDLYLALADRWDSTLFQSIAASEQRHMDAVDGLIARNQLTDTTPAAAGQFSIPELQELYDDLLAQGNASLDGALRVGVAVEETDIADLKAALAVTRDATVQRVLGNLSRASAQHLAAFTAAAGGTPVDTLCPAGGRKGACAGKQGAKDCQPGTCTGPSATPGSGTCPKAGAATCASGPTGSSGKGATAGNKAVEPARNGRR